jgi:hypothetical protein
MKRFDVLAYKMKKFVIAASEIVEHEGMPFSQRRGDLIYDRLNGARRGVVSRFEREPRREGFCHLRFRRRDRPEACGIYLEGIPGSVRLVWARADLEGFTSDGP